MLQQSASSSASGTATTPNLSQPQAMWPADMEINPISNSTKLGLGNQSESLCLVIRDTFKYLWGALCYINVFPDAMTMPTMIRDCLISAAKGLGSRASNIHQRILSDEAYVNSLMPLVSFNILILYNH